MARPDRQVIATPAVAAAGRPLVLATYNVHRFCGTDGVCDPTRVAGVVDEMRPDVIAVQEADLPRHQPIDASTFVRWLPGYACVAAPGRRVGGRWFGNLVLSRLPILSAERVDLSHARREPRSALDVVIDLGGAVLRVVAAHLGLVHRERRGQVDRLLERIEDEHQPFLSVLGDFNDWIPGRPALRRLERHLGIGRRVRSFPSFRPLLCLDRIWVHPGAALLELRAHRSALARRASDHLPVVARVARPEGD